MVSPNKRGRGRPTKIKKTKSAAVDDEPLLNGDVGIDVKPNSWGSSPARGLRSPKKFKISEIIDDLSENNPETAPGEPELIQAHIQDVYSKKSPPTSPKRSRERQPTAKPTIEKPAKVTGVDGRSRNKGRPRNATSAAKTKSSPLKKKSGSDLNEPKPSGYWAPPGDSQPINRKKRKGIKAVASYYVADSSSEEEDDEEALSPRKILPMSGATKSKLKSPTKVVASLKKSPVKKIRTQNDETNSDSGEERFETDSESSESASDDDRGLDAKREIASLKMPAKPRPLKSKPITPKVKASPVRKGRMLKNGDVDSDKEENMSESDSESSVSTPDNANDADWDSKELKMASPKKSNRKMSPKKNRDSDCDSESSESASDDDRGLDAKREIASLKLPAKPRPLKSKPTTPKVKPAPVRKGRMLKNGDVDSDKEKNVSEGDSESPVWTLNYANVAAWDSKEPEMASPKKSNRKLSPKKNRDSDSGKEEKMSESDSESSESTPYKANDADWDSKEPKMVSPKISNKKMSPRKNPVKTSKISGKSPVTKGRAIQKKNTALPKPITPKEKVSPVRKGRLLNGDADSDSESGSESSKSTPYKANDTDYNYKEPNMARPNKSSRKISPKKNRDADSGKEENMSESDSESSVSTLNYAKNAARDSMEPKMASPKKSNRKMSPRKNPMKTSPYVKVSGKSPVKKGCVMPKKNTVLPIPVTPRLRASPVRKSRLLNGDADSDKEENMTESDSKSSASTPDKANDTVWDSKEPDMASPKKSNRKISPKKTPVKTSPYVKISGKSRVTKGRVLPEANTVLSRRVMTRKRNTN